MTDIHDETTLLPAPESVRRPARPGWVRPIKGALESAYRRHCGLTGIRSREDRGKPLKRKTDYPTKVSIMTEIQQESASAWRNINAARNDVPIARAIQLADILEVHPSELFELDRASRRKVEAHVAAKRRAWLEEEARKWAATMKRWSLPLKAADLPEVATWLKSADVIRIADPDFEDVDLPVAQLVDEFGPRVTHARVLVREGQRVSAVAFLADYLKEISSGKPWRILAGRYVQRILEDEDYDAYGHPHIRADKVLVLKLSTKTDDPGHVIDRTPEANEESTVEHYADDWSQTEFGELIEWCDGREIWRELPKS